MGCTNTKNIVIENHEKSGLCIKLENILKSKYDKILREKGYYEISFNYIIYISFFDENKIIKFPPLYTYRTKYQNIVDQVFIFKEQLLKNKSYKFRIGSIDGNPDKYLEMKYYEHEDKFIINFSKNDDCIDITNFSKNDAKNIIIKYLDTLLNIKF